MKKGISIKYQLRLNTFIPVCVLALLFAIFYNAQLAKDVNQHMSRLGKAYVHQLLPAAQFAMIHNDKRILQGLINASTVNPEIISMAFYDFKGRLMAYRGGKHSMHHPFTPPEFTGDYTESKRIKPNVVNFIAPITIPKYNLYTSSSDTARKEAITLDADEILGWLSIDIDTQPLLIKRYQMILITIFITLFGLIISLSIHYFFSRRIYIPITRLKRSLKKIENHHFDTPISINSAGEVGEIERGCAYLQKQYLNKTEELQNTIQELNHNVETASEDLQQNLVSLEEKNIELMLEKKKTEEKGRQKSEFIANMSHEIRTPMNAIIGFTNVLLESKLDPLQLDYVKTIKSSSQDLLQIINDVLDYSKIDAGKLLLDCIPVDLRACIDEVVILASPIAHKKGIDLIPSTDIFVPKTLLGDPLRIKQILTNLINNAIKFTEKGHVLIESSIEEEKEDSYLVSISINDTGTGIAKEDQAKLFHAFTQADTSITRRFGGSGLGLIICKQLAEAMQGRISLTSELHKGTTFIIKIKLEKMASFETEKHQIVRFSKLKAICFDENPLQRKALCNALGFLGIPSFSVSNFRQLEKAFNKNREGLIAFVHVNEGSEKPVAEIIKSHKIPTILISKWLIHNHEALGAKGFLFKPISIQKLQDSIESLLKNIKPTVKKRNNQHNLRQQIKEINPEILIAEDNPLNQMLLQNMFHESAHLKIVTNGEDAVHACQEKQYHILLLDLQMPKLDGLQAARQIRQKSSLNKITPIILISANTSDLKKQEISEAGIDLSLQKPLDEKQFLTHILKLLKKVRKNDLSSDAKTPAIDWPLCVQKMSNNETAAKDYLARFVKELPLEKKTFKQLTNKKDIHGIEKAAHKLLGACCFCGVPRLEEKLRRLETKAKKAKKINELSTLVMELLKCIDEVTEEYTLSHP